MNEFTAPIDDICFALKHAARLDKIANLPAFEHLEPEMVRDLMSEAGRFMGDVVAPTNRAGDEHGAVLRDGRVDLPEGYQEAYDAVVEAGCRTVIFERPSVEAAVTEAAQLLSVEVQPTPPATREQESGGAQ